MRVEKPGYIGGAAGPTDRNHFRRIAKIVAKEGAIITTHDTPDVDGLGGAYALKRHLEKPGAPVDIVTGRTTHLTDPLVERLGMALKGWRDISASDARPLIVVDTGTPSLLTGCKKTDVLAVIDHHLVNNPPLEARMKIVRKAVAGCQIIASLIPAEAIDPEMALALAVGIAGDSEKLNDVDKDTLPLFERLAAICGEDKKTLDLLAYPPLGAHDLKVILDEMRYIRTEIYRDRLIAIGESCLENPAIMASMLRDMNVSVTAILCEVGSGQTADENVYKVSYRVRNQDAGQGVYASDIARETSRKCGMPENMLGGGHRDKAGAVVRGTYDRLVQIILETAKEAMDRALGQKV
ncbi:MAG: DHH family phosphoesterase [Candidatus ainarchaeum sp.]|nr:DHH family phosphoesterase [Candidatus ainarchaeum sp.]